MKLFGRKRRQSAGSRPGHGYRAGFRRGFLTTIVLWPGVIPFGIAFAIVAHAGGFSLVETQALSLLVFAGAAQLITVTLAMSGVAAIPIVLTAFLLNLRHVLYGLSLSRWLPGATRPPRGILAFFLTDESYGLTIKAFLDQYGTDAFLFGSQLSLFGSWNVATLAGSLLGALLPNPYHIGLDFIFPLAFLALLVPLLRNWQSVVVALTSVAVAAVAGHFAASGVAVLAAGVCAAGLGTVLDRPRPDQTGENEPTEPGEEVSR
jgi:4-azaleucine resistance transporter AzlC